MKILAISHSCVTDVNQQLFVALHRVPGVDLELLTPDRWRDDYSREARPPTYLPGLEFPARRLPIAFPGHVSLHFYSPGLGRAIAAASPTVVFVDEEPWSLPLLQVAHICRRKRIPMVCYTKQNIRKRYPPPFSWIEQATYRRAAAIIALTEEARAVLRAKGFRGPAAVLPHGCDPALFHPQPSGELRAALGLRGTVVGYMGRLVSEKGLDTLVHAMARLQQAQPGVEISALLVGSGPEEANLRRVVQEAGLERWFVFAGAVPHAQAGRYLNCMDILVLPSRTTPTWKEQFGRVVIEALACGVPVVGSSSGEIPSLVRDTGGGLVFQEGDAEDLFHKIAALARSPGLRADLARAGGAAVESRYTYGAVAAQLYAILADAAAPATGRVQFGAAA